MHTTFEEIKAQIHNSTFAFLHHSSASDYMRTRFVHTRARFRKKTNYFEQTKKTQPVFFNHMFVRQLTMNMASAGGVDVGTGISFFIFIFSLLFKTKIKRLSIHRLPDNLEKTLLAV